MTRLKNTLTLLLIGIGLALLLLQTYIIISPSEGVPNLPYIAGGGGTSQSVRPLNCQCDDFIGKPKV